MSQIITVMFQGAEQDYSDKLFLAIIRMPASIDWNRIP